MTIPNNEVWNNFTFWLLLYMRLKRPLFRSSEHISSTRCVLIETKNRNLFDIFRTEFMCWLFEGWKYFYQIQSDPHFHLSNAFVVQLHIKNVKFHIVKTICEPNIKPNDRWLLYCTFVVAFKSIICQWILLICPMNEVNIDVRTSDYFAVNMFHYCDSLSFTFHYRPCGFIYNTFLNIWVLLIEQAPLLKGIFCWSQNIHPVHWYLIWISGRTRI